MFVFAAAFGLLALPSIAYRALRRLKPKQWVRLVTLSMLFGAALLVFGLLLAAAPIVLASLGLTEFARVCARLAGHGLPGATVGGWVAGIAALGLVAGGAVQASLTTRRQKRLASLAVKGVHRSRVDDCQIIEVQSPTPFAVALRDKSGRVVVASALDGVLTPPEWDAVIRHEVEHVRRRHWRHLVLVATVARMLGWIPLVRTSANVLRLGLEREADEAAAGPGRIHRATVRSALLKLATADLPDLGVPAFTSATPVAERLRALTHVTKRSTEASLLVHASVVAVVGAGMFGVGVWLGHEHSLATIAALCPI